MQNSHLRAPRTNALSIRPQEHEHFWQPSAQSAARGFFRSRRGEQHLRRRQHITALPRGWGDGFSLPPRISKGGGAVAMIIFHFVDGLRAVFTMIFAMFSARRLERFYKLFCKASRACLQDVLQGFYSSFTRSFARCLDIVYKVFCKAFTTCLQGVLQGFYNSFTRSFARLLQHVHKVFRKAVTTCLQGVLQGLYNMFTRCCARLLHNAEETRIS